MLLPTPCSGNLQQDPRPLPNELPAGFKQACEDEKSSKLVGKVFFCSDNNLMSTGLHDRLQLQQRSGNELQALDDQDLAKLPSSDELMELKLAFNATAGQRLGSWPADTNA